MLVEMIDVQTLFKQDLKQQQDSNKRIKFGHCRKAGHRDALVRLPISFVPTKCSATSQHYIHHKQNNEDIYISQLDFFSLTAEAYMCRADSSLEEGLVGRPTRLGVNNNMQVCLFKM